MFRVSIFILAVLYDVLWNISSQVVENGQIFEQSANTTLGHEKENLVQFAGNEFFRNFPQSQRSILSADVTSIRGRTSWDLNSQRTARSIDLQLEAQQQAL